MVVPSLAGASRNGSALLFALRLVAALDGADDLNP